MNIGQLKYRATLYRPVKSTETGSNAPTVTPEDAGKVWANFTQLQGTEEVRSGQDLALYDAKFKLRYRTDVTPEWEIELDGVRYRIIAVTTLGWREAIELWTKAEAVERVA